MGWKFMFCAFSAFGMATWCMSNTVSESNSRDAVTLYCDPNGTGSSCSIQEPCRIETAVQQVQGEAEIVLNPGIYRISQELYLNSPTKFTTLGEVKLWGSEPLNRWHRWSKSMPFYSCKEDRPVRSIYLTNAADQASDPKGKYFKLKRVTTHAALNATPGSFIQSGGTIMLHRPANSTWTDANKAQIEAVFHTESLIKLGPDIESLEMSGMEMGLSAGLSHLLMIPTGGSVPKIELKDMTFAWCWDDLSSTLSSNIIVQRDVVMNAERIRSYGAKNDGLSVKAPSMIHMTDSHFYDCGDETFSPHLFSRGVATNCTFSGGGALDAGPPSDGHAVAVVQGSDWSFYECSFTQSRGLYPTVWVADLDTGPTAARFYNCNFSSGTTGALSARAGILFSGNSSGQVIGCSFTDYLNPSSGCGRGIVYQNEVAGKATTLAIRNNVFTHVRVGIDAVNKAGVSASEIRLSENIFVNVALEMACGQGWSETLNGIERVWN